MLLAHFNVSRGYVVSQSRTAADVLIVGDQNASPVHYHESYHSQQICRKYPEGKVLPFIERLPEQDSGEQTYREEPPGIRINIAVVIRMIHA